MIIKKEYKHAELVWDEDSERLEITNENGTTTSLPRNYVFPLMRFCVRILQRYFISGMGMVKKREERKNNTN
jgi:hypothetical protein